MFRSPFQYQSERPSRKIALDYFKRPDVYLRLVLGVECMKVRWGVVAPDIWIEMP
jgi:hypothetical protein